MQKAKCCCLEEPAQSPVITVPVFARGWPPYAVISAGAPQPVGFRGVRRDLLDSLEQVGPLMVVGHQPPPSGRILGGPASGLLFWSGASDHGWGANHHDLFILGHWSVEERELSINFCELRAIHLGLHHFATLCVVSKWGCSRTTPRPCCT